MWHKLSRELAIKMICSTFGCSPTPVMPNAGDAWAGCPARPDPAKDSNQGLHLLQNEVGDVRNLVLQDV